MNDWPRGQVASASGYDEDDGAQGKQETKTKGNKKRM